MNKLIITLFCIINFVCAYVVKQKGVELSAAEKAYNEESLAAFNFIYNTNIKDICLLPPLYIDNNLCLAREIRYAYKAQLGKCVKFIYGGCLGTPNLFRSLQTCEETCAHIQKPTQDTTEVSKENTAEVIPPAADNTDDFVSDEEILTEDNNGTGGDINVELNDEIPKIIAAYKYK